MNAASAERHGVVGEIGVDIPKNARAMGVSCTTPLLDGCAGLKLGVDPEPTLDGGGSRKLGVVDGGGSVAGVVFDGCNGVGAARGGSALPVHESRCSLMRCRRTLVPQQGQSAKREPPESADACLARFMLPPSSRGTRDTSSPSEICFCACKFATDDTAKVP